MNERKVWIERDREAEAIWLVKLLEPSAEVSERHLKLPAFSWPCNQAYCRGKELAWLAAGEQWQSWWPATCTGCRPSVLWLWREWGTTEGWCLDGWKDRNTKCSVIQTLSAMGHCCSLSKPNLNVNVVDITDTKTKQKARHRNNLF